MIWYKKFDLKDINDRGSNTMVEYVGIEITEIGDDFIKATMPIDSRTVQPLRLLHGGANCVLAESLGSVASNLVVNPATHYAVGVEIHAHHVSSGRSGLAHAIAKPIKLGKSLHFWNIDITDDKGELLCVSRLTTMVKERK
jgi:1,4-dihydroxy-2-naphthoyl-CoA hydrolase